MNKGHQHLWELWRTNFTAGTYTYRCWGCQTEEERVIPYVPPHVAQVAAVIEEASTLWHLSADAA